MKILVIINKLDKGGAENLIVQTLPEFKKRGLSVDMIQFSSNDIVPEYQRSLQNAGIIIHDLGCNSVYSFKIIKKLKTFIRQHHYDLIHVHLFPAQYWAAFALRALKIPMVFTEHASQNRRWGKYYFKLLDKYTYKKYRKIIAITEDVKTALGNWMPSVTANIAVINNGIDLKKIEKIQPLKRSDLLSALGINDPDAKLLLMTARFSWPKTQNLIIKALNKLDPHIHLLLAGEGALQNDSKKLAAATGVANRVHFLNFRTDTASLMKSVDINILSTDFEGLSTVSIEALASGRPFLGSDVTGVNNVVPDKRFLFDKNNHLQLATKITEILENKALKNEMETTGLRHSRYFDIQKMIDKHIDLYKSIL